MTRHAKASSAGSTQGQGSRLGSLRRAFATRGASSDANVSGAPSHPRKRVLFAGGLLALLSVLVLLSATASADSSFGEEEVPNAGHLTTPRGVAVDPTSGDLYVADGFGHRVDKFDAEGNSLFAFGLGVENGAEEEQTCTVVCHSSPFTANSVKGPMLDEAQGIAADPTSGDVYVADRGYTRVMKFDSAGHFILGFGGDVVAYGPDNSSTNESQSVTVEATGGTFQLKFYYPYADAYEEGGLNAETAALPYNATAAEVESALNALSDIGGLGGSVAVTGGPGNISGSNPYEVTFEDNLAGDDLHPLEPIYFHETEFGREYTLTGGEHKAEVETTVNGGGPEICKLSAGDVCKTGGDFESGAGGTFNHWAENAGLIAVDGSGTVYVGDTNRVEKFASNGSFAGQINVPGGGKVEDVAVDGSGDIFVISEGLSGVQEFNSSGTLVRTLHPSGQPKRLAVDGSGDVFVGTEPTPGEPDAAYEFAAYKPDGTLYAQFGSALLAGFDVGGIAIGDAAGQLYATNTAFGEHPHHQVVAIPLPAPGPPVVKAGSEVVTNIKPSTATLHAVVNPEAFDTEYHFEYVDQEHFANGGFSNPATHSTTFTDLGSVSHDYPVQAAISSLTPATVYHWRVVAANHCNEAQPSQVCTTEGPDETFETLPPVSVRDFTTQTVGPELVTLKVELNPNGQFTTYTIHYGKDTSYSEGSSQGTLPVGNEFVQKEVTFASLEPNTVYHYQLVAENGNGEVKTTDQTFTTELSGAEERAGEACPNTNLREENNSLPLPDCRAYEQVSATQKEGGEAFDVQLAPSGERVAYLAIGAFAGAEVDEGAVRYLAQRSPAGWVSQAAVRRAGPGYEPGFVPNFSPELDRWVFSQMPGLESVNVDGREVFYSVGSADGAFDLRATPTLSPTDGKCCASTVAERIGQSDDLSRLFVPANHPLLSADQRPSDTSLRPDRIYEISGVGGANPILRLAAEVPPGLTSEDIGGSSAGGCYIDHEHSIGRGGRFATADGSTIFYTVPIEVSAGELCGEGTPNPIGLFARTGEAAPVQLNAPPPSQCSSPAPCATAEPTTPLYDGAAPDGSFVWFTTTQPLVNSDTDTTNDLYVAKLENGQLSEIAQASGGGVGDPTPGEGADVGENGIEVGDGLQKGGVVRVSPDGSHAAFESPAILTTEENALHQKAVAGANNLYEYDAQTGETKFVTMLCSAPGLSGSNKPSTPQGAHPVTSEIAVADPACPATLTSFIGGTGSENDNELWGLGGGSGEVNQAKFTPDGRYFLFKSFGRLTHDDTDNIGDLYRYDFQTGQLIRLSFGHNGNDANGNDDAYSVSLGSSIIAPVYARASELAADDGRSVSADGSTVIFTTAAPLVSHDTNEATDVYEWEEQGHGTCTEAGGCISLVSDGVDPNGARSAVISSSGRDITFQTQRGEIPADTDGVGDIYDARVEGGFHTPHPGPICESPEACRPPPLPPFPPPKITTENETGGNGVQHLHCAKGKVRVKRHGQVRCVARHHKKKHHRAKHKRAANANRGGNK